MFIYPHINPIAFHVGPVAVHWYGLMYLISFALGWLLLTYRVRYFDLKWTKDQISDLVFYASLGVILGGRIGYILFYNLSFYIAHPIDMLKVWDGGMSFHGGMLGVLLAIWIWCFRYRTAYFQVTDLIAPIVPIGLAAGRIGNFINGELWGRVTHVPWAMIYPEAGPLPRHPSEIYEFLLEGVCLFIVLWWFSFNKKRPPMAVSGLFLLGYGLARFIGEFFRQPDPQLGFIAWGWLTMGQLLCTPMILLGMVLLCIAYKKRK